MCFGKKRLGSIFNLRSYFYRVAYYFFFSGFKCRLYFYVMCYYYNSTLMMFNILIDRTQDIFKFYRASFKIVKNYYF